MMNPNPADRITATEALSHPWTCVQTSETMISVRPNTVKAPFEPIKNQTLVEEPPIADLIAEVNASISINIDKGDAEMAILPQPGLQITLLLRRTLTTYRTKIMNARFFWQIHRTAIVPSRIQ